MMIYVKNNIIPSKGFKAITLWPFVFYKGKPLTPVQKNHEKIHGEQQKELLILIFYLIYLIETVFKGYKNISFEKEAYKHEANFNYLNERICFAMWRNI